MHRRLPVVAFVVVLALMLPLTAIAQIGSAQRDFFSLSATLSGGNEVPAGDPDGFGYARITILLDSNQLCFQTSAARIEPATASHIHAGTAGVAGPVVIPLEAPGPDGLVSGCVEADAELLRDIVANPWNYYVNVHTADYPAGAVRGQLQGPGSVPPPAPPAPMIDVVANGLDNPRGVDMAADGSVYVAEAGSGGETCVDLGTPDEPFQLCFGMTGAVTRVADGVAEQVGASLLSNADPSGMFATGPHDAAIDADGNVFTVLGLGATAEDRDGAAEMAGVAPDAAKLMMLGEDGTWVEVADFAAFEAENNPDNGTNEPFEPSPNLESNPYSVAVDGDLVLVADAGGNALYTVTMDGTITTFAVFPDVMVEAPAELGLPEGSTIPMDAVPTSVTVGPDGAYYVGQLTGYPFPVDGAKVFRLEDLNGDGDALDEGEMTVYAEGLTAIVDIEFGPDGTLYAVEIARNGLAAAEAAGPDDVEAVTGAIIAIGADGSQTEVISDGLILPGGVAVADDGSLYVTNFSVFTGSGEPAGQLVHVTWPE